LPGYSDFNNTNITVTVEIPREFSWASFEPSNNSFIFNKDKMSPGSYTIKVMLTDDVGGVNTYKLTVIATSPAAEYIIKEAINTTKSDVNSTANITVTKEDKVKQEDIVTAHIESITAVGLMTIRFNHSMNGCQNLTWIDNEHLKIYIIPAQGRD